MQQKTVMVVEDYEVQRLTLHNAFKRRGFQVESAGTVAEARRIFEGLGNQIDVAVLDMRLEDPAEPETTGADLGIEYQKRHADWTTEFLIHSAYAEVNYHKLALQLGAATYLSKAETTLEDVICHVRALALRRALRLERPKVAEAMRWIVDSTRSLSDAVLNFCQEVLAKELENCLDSPYMLLLTDENGTQNCASTTNLPLGYEQIYTVLQAMAHGNSSFAEPYVFNSHQMKAMPGASNPVEAAVYESLLNSAFVPLANVHDFRLSVGIFKQPPGEKKDSDEPDKLAAVLAQYVRSTVVEHFLRILVHLDSQKKTMLKNTSRLCLSLGQDQQSYVKEGVEQKELQEGSPTHWKLAVMADDLRQTGAILANVSSSERKVVWKPIRIKQLLEEAWADLSQKMFLDDIKFKVIGDCEANVDPEDMVIAVSRLLQWIALRKNKTVRELEPAITVRCEESPSWSQVSFEDQSNRLPEQLRRYLFMPVSLSVEPQVGTEVRGPGLYLPLFLAKMIVEEKYGGWLDDKSDEMEGEVGHRLVMRFARAKVNNRGNAAARS